MNLREWWLRLGDRNTVTIWSWILTLPFAVTVMTNYYLCDGPRDVALMAAGAFVTHCLLGGLLLISRRLLRARPDPWCALALFAAIGATRPFVLDATTAALGLPVDPRPILVRVALNTVCSVVLLSLVAVLVGALRVRIELQRDLRGARRAVALQQARDRYRLDEVRLHCRRELGRRIERLMGTVTDTELDGEQTAVILRKISDEIVRPMSHRLFRDVQQPCATPASVRMTARDRVAGVVRSVEPAPRYGPVLAYTVLIAIYLLGTYGTAFTLVQIVVGFSILVLGNMAALRWIRVRRPMTRIVFLAATYGSSALTSIAVTYILLPAFGYPPVFYFSAMFVYPTIALSVCLIRAADHRRREEEQQLRTALGEQARDAARIHAELNANRRGLARLLHNSVQGELVAASWLSQTDGNVDLPGTLERILADLEDTQPEPTVQQGESQAAARIDELLAVWRFAIPIAAGIDDSVWSLAPAGSARLEAMVDVLSEGLTNAVKHGVGGRVHITVECTRAAAITVRVSSPGLLSEGRGSGIGLASIATISSAAELVEQSGHVVLTVVLS